MQEMVKLFYRDDDIIFVSIHAYIAFPNIKGRRRSPENQQVGFGSLGKIEGTDQIQGQRYSPRVDNIIRKT